MWNRGKRSVVIDPGSAEGRAWLRNRIGGADMLITRDGEELAAFGLDGDELLASHPRLILLEMPVYLPGHVPWAGGVESAALLGARSEEHTSELQSLMRISYAVFCLKKKNYNNI